VEYSRRQLSLLEHLESLLQRSIDLHVPEDVQTGEGVQILIERQGENAPPPPPPLLPGVKRRATPVPPSLQGLCWEEVMRLEADGELSESEESWVAERRMRGHVPRIM
jgi:hypothetical protein